MIRVIDRDALIHARWHRALDDPSAEPEGPIRAHIEQVVARAQAEAGEKLAAIEAILAPKPRCRDCADMETDRCQDKPDGDYCNPLEAIRAVLRGEGS